MSEGLSAADILEQAADLIEIHGHAKGTNGEGPAQRGCAGTKHILACVPVDRSGLPQAPELDELVITDLYSMRQCHACHQDVWVGPRQLEMCQSSPDSFIILCYLDALSPQLVTADAGDVDIVHLGGGYPVEGRARLS